MGIEKLLGVFEDHDPHTNESVRRLFTALVEFAESRGVSRHPESTFTARLEAAAMVSPSMGDPDRYVYRIAKVGAK